MSFIAADEFIILMDSSLLRPDDLRRLRDAGVRTMYAYLSWAGIERTPGAYDWAPVETQIARAQQADMKLLLRCYEQAPAFFPADWYLATQEGQVWREWAGWGGPQRHTILSPWCAEAQAAELAFMRRCQELFGSDRVQLYAGVAHDGEVLLPGMVSSYYDPHAQASFEHYTGGPGLPADLATYAEMTPATQTVTWLARSLAPYVAAQQAVFPEIWLSLVERDGPFAETFESGPRSGNWLAPLLYRDLPQRLGKPLNTLLFEVYRAGGTQGALRNVLGGLEGCTWVGSQFCEGLRANTDAAIAEGLRGFITAPVHDQRPGRFEDWMLETITWSMARWAQR